MVSFAKLHIIRQKIKKIYKNIGLENFLLSILLQLRPIRTEIFSNPMFLYFFPIPCIIHSNFAKETIFF
jgi:hypothetical protein